MRHTCLFWGTSDALMGQLHILVRLSLKLSLVILDEVLSFLAFSLQPFPAGTVLWCCFYCPVGMGRSGVASHIVCRGACVFSSDATLCIT